MLVILLAIRPPVQLSAVARVAFCVNNILQLLDGLPFHTLPIQICFELTEDELISVEEVKQSIKLLQQKGYSIAIDDFGVGYSNLSYLQELNANYIKIDKVFISKLETNTIHEKLIPSIIDIADNIGAEIIVEGIETKKQGEMLRTLGVEYGQGYYFSKPMTIDEILQWKVVDRLQKY